MKIRYTAVAIAMLFVAPMSVTAQDSARMRNVRRVLLMITFMILTACWAFGQSAEIHKAAYNGEIVKLQELLKKGVDPDERDSFGGTALHAAMFQKNLEIVKLLLEYRFDVNAVGPQNGYTPLHDAVWADNLEAVKILLNKGAQTNIKGKDGLTAYGKAKKEGRKEILKHFESKGIKE